MRETRPQSANMKRLLRRRRSTKHISIANSRDEKMRIWISLSLPERNERKWLKAMKRKANKFTEAEWCVCRAHEMDARKREKIKFVWLWLELIF